MRLSRTRRAFPGAPSIRPGGAFYKDERHHRTRSRRSGRIAVVGSLLVTAAIAAAALAGCDAATETPSTGPPPLTPATADQQAIVAQAFADVEDLFALGFENAARPAGRALASAHLPLVPVSLMQVDEAGKKRSDTNFSFERGAREQPEDALESGGKRKHTAFDFSRTDDADKRKNTDFPFENGGKRKPSTFTFEHNPKRKSTTFSFERGTPLVTSTPIALAALRSASSATAGRMLTDTTTYTGVYDAVNTKGYLVQMQYRQPQGVGVWQARVQHSRLVTGPFGAPLDAVETVSLTFLDYASLEAFVGALGTGSVPYLTGASSDAEASFAAYDTWRVAQIYSPEEGQAVVSYANAELRESFTVREPVVTLNTNGTGTVRDGGPDGSVRTRYYGANFTVSATGVVSGTLLRTLTTTGDAGDGSIISRSDYPDSSFRQTRQRGGDGVVVRENTQG